MDFIHGNSCYFGKGNLDTLTTYNRCGFCGIDRKENTPKHQLFECPGVADKTHANVVTVINSWDNYIQEVITAKEKRIQVCFIKRVQFLMKQYKMLSKN